MLATDQPSHGEVGTAIVADGRLLVTTADRDVEILTLQPEGRAMMSARDWANGRRGAPVRFST